jgi:hypothetical protein
VRGWGGMGGAGEGPGGRGSGGSRAVQAEAEAEEQQQQSVAGAAARAAHLAPLQTAGSSTCPQRPAPRRRAAPPPPSAAGRTIGRAGRDLSRLACTVAVDLARRAQGSPSAAPTRPRVQAQQQPQPQPPQAQARARAEAEAGGTTCSSGGRAPSTTRRTSPTPTRAPLLLLLLLTARVARAGTTVGAESQRLAGGGRGGRGEGRRGGARRLDAEWRCCGCEWVQGPLSRHHGLNGPPPAVQEGRYIQLHSRYSQPWHWRYVQPRCCGYLQRGRYSQPAHCTQGASLRRREQAQQLPRTHAIPLGAARAGTRTSAAGAAGAAAAVALSPCRRGRAGRGPDWCGVGCGGGGGGGWRRGA